MQSRSQPSALRTELGWSTADDVFVRGHNLSTELIGTIDLTQMTYLLIRGRLPTPEESRMLTALMVTIVEHGITPSVIAARMTYLGAPEALQGAIAAGLLGAGSVYLGAMETTGQMLVSALAEHPDEDLETIAGSVVRGYRERREIIPGIGHPIHTGGDPRVATLFALAEELGFFGKHPRLLQAIADEASRGRRLLPVNAAGAIGAISVEMGFDWRVAKGLALIARTIGLVGHVFEEMTSPTASRIWSMVEETVEHPGPGPSIQP
jgi:citrate synthase